MHYVSKFLIINTGLGLNSKKTDGFRRFDGVGLIKTTDLPVSSLAPEQKAVLNRKGNEFFNAGNIEAAKRIFITTGYSDGLSRVGDHYAEKDRELDALKMYWLAHNRRKADPIIKKLAFLIQSFAKS